MHRHKFVDLTTSTKEQRKIVICNRTQFDLFLSLHTDPISYKVTGLVFRGLNVVALGPTVRTYEGISRKVGPIGYRLSKLLQTIESYTVHY